METREIHEMIRARLPEAQINVSDSTGSGDHFHIEVVSSAFEGKTKVERHRLVYSALGSLVGGAIHAASLDTRTPTEMGGK